MVGSLHASVRAAQLQGGEAAVRGVEDGAHDGFGVLVVTHDCGTGDQLLRWWHDEDDGDDGNVVDADPLDLSAVDVETFRCLLELAEAVDGRDRDESVACTGGNRAFGETDCFVFAASQGDPHEAAQPRDL